jgi:hypothetical protein
MDSLPCILDFGIFACFVGAVFEGNGYRSYTFFGLRYRSFGGVERTPGLAPEEDVF